jgi:hypothetical protein
MRGDYNENPKVRLRGCAGIQSNRAHRRAERAIFPLESEDSFLLLVIF